MNLKEKTNLIKNYYDGDYTLYFYDTIKEYSKTLCDGSIPNALALQELIRNLINDVEEIIQNDE